MSEDVFEHKIAEAVARTASSDGAVARHVELVAGALAEDRDASFVLDCDETVTEAAFAFDRLGPLGVPSPADDPKAKFADVVLDNGISAWHERARNGVGILNEARFGTAGALVANVDGFGGTLFNRRFWPSWLLGWG